MSTKLKPKKKEFLKISEVASLLKCSDINIYHHIKNQNLKTISKSTYIQDSDGAFVPTGEHRTYITRQSVEDKLSNKTKRKVKGKQIRAVYIDSIDKTFENGKKEIVFISETTAAKELKISKFALRHRLLKGNLVHDEIKVSVVPKEK